MSIRLTALLNEFEGQLSVDEPTIVSFAERAQRILPKNHGYWVVSFSRHARWLLRRRGERP